MEKRPGACRAPNPDTNHAALVLVDEPAEDVSPPDSRASHSLRTGSRIRRSKVDAPVRPGPVVVLGVRVQDTLQMAPAEDQYVVEAVG